MAQADLVIKDNFGMGGTVRVENAGNINGDKNNSRDVDDLIVGFDPRPNIGAPIGFIAPASAFAPYLNGPVISRVDSPAQTPEMSMN